MNRCVHIKPVLLVDAGSGRSTSACFVCCFNSFVYILKDLASNELMLMLQAACMGQTDTLLVFFALLYLILDCYSVFAQLHLILLYATVLVYLFKFALWCIDFVDDILCYLWFCFSFVLAPTPWFDFFVLFCLTLVFFVWQAAARFWAHCGSDYV